MQNGVAWTVSVLLAIVANLALASILAWRIRWHSHDLLFPATSARNPSVTGMFPPGRRMMDALPQCEKWSGEDGLAGQILQAEIRLAQRRLAVRTQAARLAHDLRRRLPQALTLHPLALP